MYLLRAIFLLGLALMTIVTALLLWAIVCPWFALSTRQDSIRQQRMRRLLSALMRVFVTALTGSRVARVSYEGMEKSGQAGIIVANHPSFLDSFILLSRFPDCVCVTKPALHRIPILRSLLKALGYLSNDGSGELIERGVKTLHEGANLLLFPEGTRTPPAERIGAFKPGVGALLVRSGVPAWPVSIRCSPPFLFKGQSLVSLPSRPFEFHVTLCDPLPVVPSPSSLAEERRLRGEVVRQLHDVLSNALA